LLGTEEGIFETKNAGQTWDPASLSPVNVGAQTLFPFRPRTIDAIATSRLVPSYEGVEYETRLPGDGYEIYGMVVTDHNGILAATSRGLMKSDAAGQRWLPLPGVLAGSTVTAICKHPTRAGVIFASKFGVIFISKDEGHSWTSLSVGQDGTEVITQLLVAPEIPDRILALTRNHGVYSISLGVSAE
jgi:photosystem II stability/assembly factor-like uncharacterized protein